MRAAWLVAGLFAASLALAFAHKAPCASGEWGDGRQYERYCYSDIVPLYHTEQLSEGRRPFLDPCKPVEGQNCDEYPVLTMYAMRLSAMPVDSLAGFFYANAVLLTLAAAITVWFLFQMCGRRALWFILAPSFVAYTYLNWDLFPVAAATAATYYHLRANDAVSGVLLGVGAAFKLYPALLVVPFALDRARRKDVWSAGVIAAAAAGSWVVFNLPFALFGREGWSTFFRFNSERPADFDSLWYIGCRHFQGACFDVPTINRASALVFVVLAASLYLLKARRDPSFARWTFAFPLLLAFLLTNKVYSPQYSLWLLPWLPLLLKRPWPFVAFAAADLGVFLTRFAWFGELSGLSGVPYSAFETALLVRAAVIVWLLADYVLSSHGDDELAERWDPAVAPALGRA